MTSIFSRAAVAFALLAGAHFAHATQTVFPASDAFGTVFSGGPNNGSVSKFGGQQLVFYGRYTSTNPEESGLGLKIQFDPAKILSVTVDLVLTKCIVSFPPDASVAGQVLFAWADTSVRNPPSVGWPTQPDGMPPDGTSAGCITLPGPPPGYVQTTAGVPIPTNLFRFTATTAPSFTSGSTNIALTSTGAGPFTATNLQVNGAVAPPCNLDVDNSGGTPTSLVDGKLIKNALNSFLPAANITLGILFPGSATRTVGSDIRTYVLGMGNVLDVDTNGTSAPTSLVDGKLIQNALNTFLPSSAVTLGVTTAATGAQVRTYLNNNCGTSLTP